MYAAAPWSPEFQPTLTFQLDSQALQLLSSTLLAGTSRTASDNRVPAFVPPPYLISLIGTLTVHPSLTTRTKSLEKHHAADQALLFLRHINKLVGAKAANFGEAFAFINQAGSSARRPPTRRHGNDQEHHGSESDEEEERVKTNLANTKSLWTRSEDFWQVLGWAFNCSVNCDLRWKRWELWLTFMLETLEDDLFECVKESREHYRNGREYIADTLLLKCMIAQYLEPSRPLGRTGRRRIMRAILANGDAKSATEFKEIWPNETKPPRQESSQKMSRKRKIDIEQDDYGDYLQNSEPEMSDTDGKLEEQEEDAVCASNRTAKTPSKTHLAPTADSGADEDSSSSSFSSSSPTTAPPKTPSYGPVAALTLRRRALVLLANAATYLPASIFTTRTDLLATYTEFLRPLPLPTFAFFTTPSPDPHSFPPALLSSLDQILLQELLTTAAPRFEAVARLAQAQLQAWYLPWTANTHSAADNAKVSLLVESLARLVLRAEAPPGPGLVPDEGRLRAAVEKGIAAREDKVAAYFAPVHGGRRKRGGGADDGEARVWLAQSAMRLRLLLDVVGA